MGKTTRSYCCSDCLPTLTAKCSIKCHMLPLNGQLPQAIPDTTCLKSTPCLVRKLVRTIVLIIEGQEADERPAAMACLAQWLSNCMHGSNHSETDGCLEWLYGLAKAERLTAVSFRFSLQPAVCFSRARHISLTIKIVPSALSMA